MALTLIVDQRAGGLWCESRKGTAELQDTLAMVDLISRVGSTNSDALELILKEIQPIKIRMDGSKNHKRPHVHIDYGKQHHAASYAIDTGERIVGDLPRKYDRRVQTWIGDNRPKLFEAWALTQTGRSADTIACELRGE